LAVVLDADETMVIPGITLVVEGIESPDLLEDRLLHRMRERIHASRYHDAAAAECSPEVVVQGAQLRALGDFTLFLCISLTHFNLRRVTGGPSHADPRRDRSRGDSAAGFRFETPGGFVERVAQVVERERLQHRADGIRLVSESGRARREGALA